MWVALKYLKLEYQAYCGLKQIVVYDNKDKLCRSIL